MTCLRVFLFGLVAWAWTGTVAADITAAPATLGGPDAAVEIGTSAVPGCPDQGGILDSVSVPVGDPLELAVVLTGDVAPEGGARFRLSSDDPPVVAVGDRRQAFLPEVFIPEGESVSNPFTVFGIEVGETILRAIPLTSGFQGFAVPTGAWDVGDDEEDKFLDPNRPGAHCRVADDSPELSTSEANLAGCGVNSKGAVTDGVTRLLMRMQSGLPGTGCFEIVSAGEDDGEIETALETTENIGGLHQVSSYYRTPDSFLESAPSRTVEVEFTFTPAIGNGNTSRFTAETELVRPPVVLIHGLWSSRDAWVEDFWVRNDHFHTTGSGDYEGTNDSGFAVNVSRVREFLREAVETSRNKNNSGYATTQVDVIGHSMGGNLARLFTGEDDYSRPENLGEGDIRRLVTLATPHLGSSFANLVVALHDAEPEQARETIDRLIPADDADPRRGAICDLAENSPALLGLAGGTDVPGHVITATGGPTGTLEAPAEYWGGRLGRSNFEAALTQTECVERMFVDPGFVCVEERHLFPQGIVDGHRFRQLNDAIVPLTSAGAALSVGSAARRNFDVLHFGVDIFGWTAVQGPTNVAEVADHVLPLLDRSLEESVWAAALPPFAASPPSPLPDPPPVDGSGVPWTVPGIPGGDGPDAGAFEAQCGAGGPLTPVGAVEVSATIEAADSRIQVTEPEEGQEFAPGDTVQVILEVEPSLEITDANVGLLAGGGTLDMDTTDLLTWEGEFFIPEPMSGPIRIAPQVRTVDGERVSGPERTIYVIPDESPEEISLGQNWHRLDLTTGETTQLGVRGTYPGGVKRMITEAIFGTTYTSDNPEVAVVDEDGLVTPVSAGTTTITVEHGELVEFALIYVRESQELLPPTDVTERLRITRGGLRLNRNNGFFVQQLQMTNPGSSPVIGPLYALVRDLPANVTLISKNRDTSQVEPLGTPYFNVPLGTDGLSVFPSATIERTLEFLNPDRATIDYEIEVIHTDLQP